MRLVPIRRAAGGARYRAAPRSSMASEFMRQCILEAIHLSHELVIDRAHRIVGVRLTVHPAARGQLLDAGELLDYLEPILHPASGCGVWLNPLDEDLVRGLLSRSWLPRMLTLEVPAFMLAEQSVAQAVECLHHRGNRVAVKGGVLAGVPEVLANKLSCVVVDLDVERSLDGLGVRASRASAIPMVHAGVRGLAQLRASFDCGATSVIGWPLDDAVSLARDSDLVEDIRILSSYSRDGSARLPAGLILRWCGRDFAQQVLSCINRSMGVLAQTASATHVLQDRRMRVGQWLPVLASASCEPDVRIIWEAARARAFVMANLAGQTPGVRDEMFLCGALSLLDRLFGRTQAHLLEIIPVPDRVHQALVAGEGPYAPYLKLARSLESGSREELASHSESAFVTKRRLNELVLGHLHDRTLQFAPELP